MKLAERGFLNVHASLLPKWRGAAPIQRSIINQDKVSGVSFMKIEEGLDTGPYMKQIKVNLDNQVTTGDLSKKLSDIGANNILKCIELIENDQAIFVNQDNHEATYAKKIIKSELKFLDPACGCGNFLIITYREIRLLELEIIELVLTKVQGLRSEVAREATVNISQFAKVNVDQFYGIEYDEFPARIAEVAMWLMDHQMNLFQILINFQ